MPPPLQTIVDSPAGYLLGSGAITLVLIAMVQGVLKLVENRTTLKNARLAHEHDEEIADAVWNAAYRSMAEQHLPYDLTVQQEIRELRTEINELRRALNMGPKNFQAIPPPPPLFPRRDDLKTS